MIKNSGKHHAGKKAKLITRAAKPVLAFMILAVLFPAALSAQSPAAMHLMMATAQNPKSDAPHTANELTLEQLEQLAMANNPTLGQAHAEARAATGRIHQAGLWPNPSIGYVGEEIRGGSFRGGQQGVFVQQDVILGGKLGLDRRVLTTEGRQAETEAEEQRLRIENGVRMAFYQSLAAQRIEEIRMRLSELARDAANTTEQLFNTGSADEPDMLQARVEADQAELSLVCARQDKQRAWQTLAAVVGKPDLPTSRLAGDLEDVPHLDFQQVLATILAQSPSAKMAQLSIARASALTDRARREVVPDISVRAGYLDNHEQLSTLSPTPVGSEGFAEVSVHLRLFDRNQGNIEAARAEQERASLEVQRVGLVLRQMAAPLIERYSSSLAVAERYKISTLPSAQRAYELYQRKYHEGGAAWPQVLIAQRTFFQLQVDYISTLEEIWMSAVPLQGLLLTDALDLPTRPGELDRPVREINLPVEEMPAGSR
jgi:outer membrane protein, heavy metal efflux system